MRLDMKTRKKRIYEKYYGKDVKAEVIHIWIFSMFLCAKRLVTFIRNDYLSQKFDYDKELKTKLSALYRLF